MTRSIFTLALTKSLLILSLLIIPVTYSHAMEWSEPVNCSTLNSSQDEFAPSWNRFENKLYFNSTRSNYSRFYMASLADTLFFGEVTEEPGKINKPGNHQSYITFLSSEVAYISTYKLFKNRSYLNILKSYKKKQVWTEAVVSESLGSEDFSSHPSISPDGSIMVFSTTRNSLDGDTDLWMAYRMDNGSWGSLVSIDELNSPGNEITPCLVSADTLYFSTDGQRGSGSYDIYLSVRRDGLWQRPEPVTEINTEFSESDPCLLPDKRIVFSSDRPGGAGGLDLYIANYEIKSPGIEAQPSVEIILEANVTAIKAKNNYSYSSYPLINYIFFKDLTNSVPMTLAGSEPEFKGTSGISFDSLYIYTPAIISSRLMDNEGSKLTLSSSNGISVNDDENTDNKESGYFDIPGPERVFSYFTKFKGIEESRIISNNLIEDHPNPFGIEYILLSSENEEIFAPVDIGRDRISLEPPLMELTIESHPNKDMKSWRCELICETGTFDCDSGKALPAVPIVDLTKYDKGIWNSDSLVFRISVEMNSYVYTKDFVFPVVHSKIDDRYLVTLNRENYERYYLFLVDIAHLPVVSGLKEIRERLSGSNRKLVVRYFNNSPACRSLVDALISEIRSYRRDIRIEKQLSSKPEGFDLNPAFSNFIFEILIKN